MYITIYCMSLIKYMGNLSSCCGIISKHVYRLELPKMAPFCMKITKKIMGEDPHTPFNNNSFTYYNIYAHAHTEPGSVQKLKKKSHGKSCPGPGTLLNQHSDPCTSLFFFFVCVFCFLFCFVFVFLFFFSKFCCG